MDGIDMCRRIARELPPTLQGAALTDTLRRLEGNVLAGLKTQVEEGWRPGAGASLAARLSAWRDDTVAVVFARTAGSGPVAVAAVGGYGRAELAPGSDLDLLLLPAGRPDAGASAFLQAFLHQLWDLGLQVSASTRTPRDILADAKEDPHLLTSLVTTRHVAGDPLVYESMRETTRKALAAGRRTFLEQRRADLDPVIAYGGRDVLVKEPNLKTSPGALRSVQQVGWVEAALGTTGAPAARSRAVGRLERARDFYLYLRCLLHLMTGRKEDVLRVEHQHAVARTLRIGGEPERMMTALMRHYYDRATDVVFALHHTRDRIRGSLGGRGASRFASAPAVRPPAMESALDAACSLARSGLEPTAELLEYLWVCARTAAVDLVWDRAVFVRFRDLLLLRDSYRALSVLKLSGLLYVYLKPLRSVRHRILHNPFHRYTVDQHSLEALRVLESLPELAVSDPDRYELPRRVAARYVDGIWVVKLALLLHDVGKAYDGDHSKNGAEMVDHYLSHLPTESLIKEMVVFLTEKHLLLSAIARRGAQSDRTAADNLAREILRSPYPVEALDFLYLVTCCDASATSERGYTSYQAAALAGLYQATTALIAGTAVATGAGSAAAMETCVAELSRMGADEEVVAFARALGPRYAGVTPPEEIIADWAGLTRLRTGSFDFTVTVFNDHLKVKMLASDRPGLFSVLAGTLLVNGADIVRASIHTYRGVAIDVFVVTDVHGNEVLERQMEKELEVWIRDVRACLGRSWVDPEELDRLIAGIERSTRPVHDAFLRETTVRVERTGVDALHLELLCTDRPALLYDVTRRIAALGLDVRSASIDTTGWYVHDSFQVRAAGPLAEDRIAVIHREIEDAARPRSG